MKSLKINSDNGRDFIECHDGTAANFSTKTTAARELSMTIAVEAVTAGKFILFAEYVVSA